MGLQSWDAFVVFTLFCWVLRRSRSGVSGRVHSHVLGPVRVMDNVKQTKEKLRDCDAEVKGMNGKRVPNNMEHRIGAKTAGGDELDVKQERGQNFHESMMLFVHGTLCHSS